MGIAFALSGSLADTLANRPAPDPDKAGRFFLDTATGQLYRDDGAAWLPVRDALTDQPRTGPLIIQANDEHAFQVMAMIAGESIEFDQELSDAFNLVSGYEGLTGVSSTNTNNGVLYFYPWIIGPTQNRRYMTIHTVEFPASQSDHLVALTSWIEASGPVTVQEANDSGLGGTLNLVYGDCCIAIARWTITPTVTPTEVLNVNTLTGVVTLPAIATASEAMITNLNAEKLGGKRAEEFAPAGEGGEIDLSSISLADTLANRPTPDPDQAGRFFLDTDSGKFYRDNGAAWVEIGKGTKVIATGGVVTTSGGYTIHTFTNGGVLTVTQGGTIEYLVVGAGGGGGSVAGGGGGAGGIRTGTLEVTPGEYSATIGIGGNSDCAGQSSTFAGITALGGGEGASFWDGAPSTGASGGGGGGNGGSGGNGTNEQGHSGGSGGSSRRAGGGGGADTQGTAGSINPRGGDGGSGRYSSISGATVAYGGGGGGGTDSNAGYPTGGNGGAGGGGAGKTGAVNGANGTPNTGGGGGGGGNVSGGASGLGGIGGSGIVIVRHET